VSNAIRKAAEKWGQAEVIQGDGPPDYFLDYWGEWGALLGEMYQKFITGEMYHRWCAELYLNSLGWTPGLRNGGWYGCSANGRPSLTRTVDAQSSARCRR
jgi:hypothetical protein